MLITAVNKNIQFYQRVILMIMLVFMLFYSVGSDFFLEGFPSSSIEVVENEVHDVLDFDDNASLRTVRQEQIQIQLFVADFIADWLTIINVHELIHSLELQQCAFLPIFYQLHKTQSFVWFCSLSDLGLIRFFLFFRACMGMLCRYAECFVVPLILHVLSCL